MKYPNYNVNNIYFVDNETKKKLNAYCDIFLTKSQREALATLRQSLESIKADSSNAKKWNKFKADSSNAVKTWNEIKKAKFNTKDKKC